jgi:hypothetical protein
MNMIIKYIKEILKQYRNGISITKLEEILSKKNINEPILNIIHKSELFTLYGGIVFLRSTLTKCKKDFLKEFEDYLEGKISDKKLRESIIQNFILLIPDVLFIHWLDVNLDRKLVVFDLLFNLMIKPANIKDRLKIHFNNLIEFYTLLAIYSMIIMKNYEDNFNLLVDILKKVEPYENALQKQLFDILTVPDKVKTKLTIVENDFNNLERKLNRILKKSFSSAFNYSPKLLKRVINHELNNFNFMTILMRFEYSSFHDWLTTLIAEKIEPHNNLFEDLGL